MADALFQFFACSRARPDSFDGDAPQPLPPAPGRSGGEQPETGDASADTLAKVGEPSPAAPSSRKAPSSSSSSSAAAAESPASSPDGSRRSRKRAKARRSRSRSRSHGGSGDLESSSSSATRPVMLRKKSASSGALTDRSARPPVSILRRTASQQLHSRRVRFSGLDGGASDSEGR